MNCFAKFEKFLPHSITIPSFMIVVSQMPELDRGGDPKYKIGSQITPYKLGLNAIDRVKIKICIKYSISVPKK